MAHVIAEIGRELRHDLMIEERVVQEERLLEEAFLDAVHQHQERHAHLP